MHVETLLAPVFGANCYLLSADGSGPCVIVDAGGGVADAVHATVARRGLVPVAVLATHGHLDHTWSAAELGTRYGVPLWIHADDAYRLADPFGSLDGSTAGASGPLAQALAASGFGPDQHVVPTDVSTFTAGQALTLGGLTVRAVHAPGHTQGATLFVVDEAVAPDSVLPGPQGPLPLAARPGVAEGTVAVALTGDVLFAGTIGRTDLPGGDMPQMTRTLTDVVSSLDPRTLVLPGHGPATRLDVELRTNPYLARR